MTHLFSPFPVRSSDNTWAYSFDHESVGAVGRRWRNFHDQLAVVVCVFVLSRKFSLEPPNSVDQQKTPDPRTECTIKTAGYGPGSMLNSNNLEANLMKIEENKWGSLNNHHLDFRKIKFNIFNRIIRNFAIDRWKTCYKLHVTFYKRYKLGL